MKTSTFEKWISITWPRALALAGAAFVALAVAGAGCAFTDDNWSEGSRCNPFDSHDECSSGLFCTGQASTPMVAFCPENYCCPVDSNGNPTGDNANCQPGCNGGAASICAADMDPGACAFAAGGSLESSLALDDAGPAPAPTDAGAD